MCREEELSERWRERNNECSVVCAQTVSEFRHHIVHFCVEVVGDIPRMQVAECHTTPGHTAPEHLARGAGGVHGRLCTNNKSKLFPKRNLSHFLLRSVKFPQIEEQ